MTTKEKKTVEVLEKMLSSYAESEINEIKEAMVPGHNALTVKFIKSDPIGELGGSEAVVEAMCRAGYSTSTINQMYRYGHRAAQYMAKFEDLLSQTDTFKRIVEQR